MTNDNGGPAFPRPPVLVEGNTAHKDYHWMQDGMRLRDYYAGQALAGVDMNNIQGTHQELAEALYEIADAMVAEKRRIEDEELRLRLEAEKGGTA